MENGRFDENEPLIEGMDALPEDSFRLPRPPDDLRQSVFSRTARIVRARARRRVIVTLVVAAAAYLGGLTTAFLLPEITGRKEGPADAAAGVRPGSPGPQAGSGGIAGPDDLLQRSETAPPQERPRLLRRAGDLYLSARYDVKNALSCYRRALDAMPASERTMAEPGDTWLLAALKDARR
jgi:hypothetical protein